MIMFVDTVNDLGTNWPSNQYTKQIRAGAKTYNWISGTDGGIMAELN